MKVLWHVSAMLLVTSIVSIHLMPSTAADECCDSAVPTDTTTAQLEGSDGEEDAVADQRAEGESEYRRNLRRYEGSQGADETRESATARAAQNRTTQGGVIQVQVQTQRRNQVVAPSRRSADTSWSFEQFGDTNNGSQFQRDLAQYRAGPDQGTEDSELSEPVRPQQDYYRETNAEVDDATDEHSVFSTGDADGGELRNENAASKSADNAPKLHDKGETNVEWTGDQIYDQLVGRRVKVDGRTYYVVEGDLLYTGPELANYADKLADALGAQRELLEAKKRAQELTEGNELTSQAFAEALQGGKELHPLLKETLQLAENLKQAELTINVRSDGRLDLWDREWETEPLRYCVLRNEFADEGQYRTAVADAEQVARDWESICYVKFAYIPELDTSELQEDGSPPSGADFTVRPTDETDFVAAAFFPSWRTFRRHVLLGPSYFTIGTAGFNRVGVLRHEFGHILGCRHEHIRPEAPTACPDENLATAQPLGSYDPGSVMHYFCGGAGTRHLEFSDTDKIWIKTLYPFPTSFAESRIGRRGARDANMLQRAVQAQVPGGRGNAFSADEEREGTSLRRVLIDSP